MTKTNSLQKQIVTLSLLAAAFLGPVAVCVAQTSTATPRATPDVQTQTNASDLASEPAQKISPDELDSLIGPIALYPDPLLTQVLAASTYPLEVVQLKQWLDKNKNLRDKALAEAVAQQNWDPSVQALAAFPVIVGKLANNIQWTTDLGNAFLAQESDVMDAVQQLRAKAQANGALKTNDKQNVGTQETKDGKRAITIESAQRAVVYVPTYKTKVVYRDSDYSNDSSYSSSSDYSGYSSSSGYSGSDYSYVGYAVAAAYGYYWGRYNWRDGYADVNYNNYYNNRYSQRWNNKSTNWSNKVNNLNGDKFSQPSTEGTGRWQHDPSHRGNAPYANRDLANRFGQGNNRLPGGAGNRAYQAPGANAANQLARGNGASQLARANPGNQIARSNLSRPPGGSARPSTRPPNFGTPNRVGNRIPTNWPATARGGAFGPGDGDFARAFSARGAQSLGGPSDFRGGPPSGFRGGPPSGLSGGGPPMGGGFRGGPPMGGGLPAGGPPMGGAPPPPPHP